MGERKMQAPSIRVTPPGPNAKKAVARDTKVMATSTKAEPLVVKRAEGAVIEDVDGNLFLDFTSGVGVTNTGHAHPKVVEAIRDQAGEFIHAAGTDFYYDIQTDLAERLTEIVGVNGARRPADKRVFLTNSGTESNEAALKLVRHRSHRKMVIGFTGAFHGRSLGSLALTASKPVHRRDYLPNLSGAFHVPYANCYRCPYKMEYPSCDLWCLKIVKEHYFQTVLPPEEVGGVIAEPIQGEGGYIVPPATYFREMRKFADEFDLLLVADEVQSGFGRTGKWFAMEHFGAQADVVSLAKALGSGMPIGASVFRKELDWRVQGSHSNTFGGNPVACAAGIATIDVIATEHLLENARRQGAHLRKRLEELKESYAIVGDVRGIGLMQATEFVKDRRSKEHAVKERDRISLEAFKRGLVLLQCGRSGLRYIPPLMVSRNQVDAGLEVLETAVREVAPQKP
jgi:4-aminobutyrate aminotransferase